MNSIGVFLLQGATLGLTAAASPGPFQTYLISSSLFRGWKQGVLIAFAPLLSDAPIILIVLFALNRLPPYFLNLVGIGGGLLIIYLAWDTWKSSKTISASIPTSLRPDAGKLKRGVLINFFSPGPYLFWSLVNGPILISAVRQSWLAAGFFLAGFYGVMIVFLAGIAILFHLARGFGPKVVRALSLISVCVLLVFGGLLLYQGALGLVQSIQ